MMKIWMISIQIIWHTTFLVNNLDLFLDWILLLLKLWPDAILSYVALNKPGVENIFYFILPQTMALGH